MHEVQATPRAHDVLRQATARLHRRTDQSSLLSVLMKPEVTIQSYRTAMRALQGAYREIDVLLLKGAGYCPGQLPAYVPRVPAIRRDLTELGPGVDAGDRQPAQPIARLNEPTSEAAYLGMRYVVEGAQLGSRLIYRHLLGVFGEDIGRIGSFWILSSTPKNTWPDLMRELERVGSRDSLASAVQSARRTFRHMAQYLDVKAEVTS
ncbi:MAG: biliverdin-producing heme oxygenase [Bryobacteraceae bacterium]